MPVAVRIRALIAATLVAATAGACVAASASDSQSKAAKKPIAVHRVRVADLPDEAVLSAILVAGGVQRADGSACPEDALVVSFTKPSKAYGSGAFVKPLGVSNGGRTVNGIVTCKGSMHEFVGFHATLTEDGWDVIDVPDPGASHEHEVAKPPPPPPPPPRVVEDVEVNRPDTAPVPPPASVPFTGKYDGPEIEGYARYEGQSTCDPTPKPGTVSLRNVLLAHYPVTTSFGIDRGCDVGGKSEHKEGRAFDWGGNITNPAQDAAINDFMNKTLLATDKHGNKHWGARRMGVMYFIWNKRIWFSNRGWSDYEGSSPHTDHMHISLSWAGARGETSFWSGKVVKGLPSTQGGGWRRNDDGGRDRDKWRDRGDDDDEEHWWERTPEPTALPTLPPVLETPTPTPTPTPSETIPADPATTDSPSPSPTPSRTRPPWWD